MQYKYLAFSTSQAKVKYNSPLWEANRANGNGKNRDKTTVNGKR